MLLKEMSGSIYGQVRARLEDGTWISVDREVLKDIEIPNTILIKKTRNRWLVKDTQENQALATAQLIKGDL